MAVLNTTSPATVASAAVNASPPKAVPSSSTSSASRGRLTRFIGAPLRGSPNPSGAPGAAGALDPQPAVLKGEADHAPAEQPVAVEAAHGRGREGRPEVAGLRAEQRRPGRRA